MTTVSLIGTNDSRTDADALVLFGQPAGDSIALVGDTASVQLPSDAVLAQLRTLAFTGDRDAVAVLPHVEGCVPAKVIVVGLGKETDLSPHERFRRGAGAAGRALCGSAQAVVVSPAPDAATAAAVTEGVVLGSYEFTRYRGANASAKPKKKLESVLLAGLSDDVAETVREANVVVQRQRWARDLVNAVPSDLYPSVFVELVREAAPASVSVTVFADEALAQEKLSGHIAVGKGSQRPPALVKLSYSPANATGHLAYVGKGITFDSGGMSLKPSEGMITMKCDMAGAAAVAGATLAIAELEVPVAITAFLCLAENMLDSTALRLGDVITYRNGTTVEVHNTDAEGRLVLADGLIMASEARPDAIVDMATLTGACVRALGTRTAGVLSNDDDLQNAWVEAAATSGEAVWPLPIPEECKGALKSSIADLCNIGSSGGGALTAAAFLREFVGKDAEGQQIPWAHVDIAGPAFLSEAPYGHVAKGGTGYGLRTLVELARLHATDAD